MKFRRKCIATLSLNFQRVQQTIKIIHSIFVSGAISQLQSHGVHITNQSRCTRESSDLYSYRADQKCGRFAGVISW
ncbi:MAG: hypothetical protein EBQ63_06985 [Actinobacteria bacterium]|nr:hypothetical protein [Actinomycetota bacterium]